MLAIDVLKTNKDDLELVRKGTSWMGAVKPGDRLCVVSGDDFKVTREVVSAEVTTLLECHPKHYVQMQDRYVTLHISPRTIVTKITVKPYGE